ncbi:hypothetical protein SDJN03_17814, partial [Cucurbita argyrosperma subsp. sororia]
MEFSSSLDLITCHLKVYLLALLKLISYLDSIYFFDVHYDRSKYDKNSRISLNEAHKLPSNYGLFYSIISRFVTSAGHVTHHDRHVTSLSVSYQNQLSLAEFNLKKGCEWGNGWRLIMPTCSPLHLTCAATLCTNDL